MTRKELITNYRARIKNLRKEANRLTERADLLKFCAQELECRLSDTRKRYKTP